jgi:hypothetical protein
MRIILEEVPLYYEITFDDEAMSISFSLCPEANDYFLEMLKRKNPMTDWLRFQKDLSPFVFPNGESWGFGNVLRMNNFKSFESGWTTWECLLPWKAKQKELYDISGSISQLIDSIQLFSHDKVGNMSRDTKQFMEIEGMIVKSDKYFGSGAFDFSYARPVLEFCARIWSEDDLRGKVIGAMQKTWIHLAGKKKVGSWDRNSFRISVCQGDPRLISLVCPGNCA